MAKQTPQQQASAFRELAKVMRPLHPSQPVLAQEQQQFQTLLRDLPEAVAQTLTQDSKEVLPGIDAGWQLVLEAHDGEWPKCESFGTPEDLLTRIQSLDGEDLTVFAYYGIPIIFSKSSPRQLYLPDGTCLARGPDGKLQTTPLHDDQELEIQEDGYLGPSTYREGLPEDEKPVPGRRIPRTKLTVEGPVVDALPAEAPDVLPLPGE